MKIGLRFIQHCPVQRTALRVFTLPLQQPHRGGMISRRGERGVCPQVTQQVSQVIQAREPVL